MPEDGPRARARRRGLVIPLILGIGDRPARTACCPNPVRREIKPDRKSDR